MQSVYGVFPPQGAGRFSPQKVRYGSRFHCQKLSRTRLAVLLRWGTETLKGCRALPASLSYTRRPLIGRQNLRGISGQRRKLRLLKKMLRKSLPSFLDVLQLLFVYCAHSSSSLDLLASYTVSGCYEITMLT